ncbi:helix-turn-helix domain-containing protein [Streptantibioticus ferralitis]|uniref:Helix-turn-helix transcriptional regulator n=1 Tax=Streptantibioticus ferralitis TaxID=236510 RepID=A0ABT5Z0H0_9ACTN|nr:helix-turn-helix transcriptional regulator [Streptantibioticus ferralitis]MDF2257332.1 helix-turn-helix transcriptional regulator [Streptantibioticus ferralitis]
MDDPKPQRWSPPEGEALVAHNLKICRKVARLSQEDVAERMRRLGFKIHQTQIAKIENGTRSITFNEVIGLAKALSVPAEHFMTEAVAGPDDPSYELQEAAFAIQAAEREWRVAQDLADAAKARLDETERTYDEIAERLGVDAQGQSAELVWYPAPNSPWDPLREGAGPSAG